MEVFKNMIYIFETEMSNFSQDQGNQRIASKAYWEYVARANPAD